MREPTMTVGDLRKALEGLDDALPVWVEAEAEVEGDIDTLHAACTGAAFRKAAIKTGSLADFFTGAPVDRLVIWADGVPNRQCGDCGEPEGKPHLPDCQDYVAKVSGLDAEHDALDKERIP